MLLLSILPRGVDAKDANRQANDKVNDLIAKFDDDGKTVKFLDIRGPIRLDDRGNPTQNVYILRVEKVGGKLQNTMIHTYPMVSQFWTYKPEDFLKDPPYTRDYPPVKP